MKDNLVQDLLKKDKLLVRAMDAPQRAANKSSYDFSVWATEVDCAKNEGLSSLSTTLLVSGEKIPTYKNMGFLLNSDLVDAHHIAETDSGSVGEFKNGDFVANKTDINTLSELAEKTRNEHLRCMNEVNINVNSEEAYVGLFVNKCKSNRPKAYILLAQEYYKQQTGKVLPIYTYDSDNGTLTPFNLTEKEKTDFISKMCEEKVIRTPDICYEIDGENRQEKKQFNYFNRIKRPPVSERIASLRKRISPQEAQAPSMQKQDLSKVDFLTMKMFKDKRVNG